MIEIKILQICSYYITSKLYQKLFNSLEKFNIEENIYVFGDRDYKINEVYPSNVLISKSYSKFDRFIFHLKHTKVLSNIEKELNIEEYDIMHAHSLFSNGYIAYKLNQKYDIPYIVAVRNTDVNLFFEKIFFLRSMGVKILRNAEKVVFISEPYRNQTIDKFIPEKYKKEIKNKSIVIPNGIDEFWLKNKYINRTVPEDKKINLIYVGVINENKNIETSIKACNFLIGQGYEISYTIIGKIKNQKYKTLMDEHLFINYIPHSKKEDLIKYYREADIFVMPSKYETFGLVYAEAMSQGLPVIYTKDQGFDRQFDEGVVGYSVQYNSAEEIADKIKDILNNYRTIWNHCINKVDRFNWNEIANEYIKVYEKSSKKFKRGS
ncbi:glycosyltransferase family 4 protein [Anaerosalibacter massiliensis]|uniref:glycosyltransferase family 4 protein n=1 Tax=Anaerosalibacter massiliensis TaxID=1347392 RepID=UPI0005B29341|nr:glycosyltransferase family 4 protein [Anaerosalibacter massiliensis]